MANLNRLKVVLAEQQKTGKWLAEQIGKSNCTVSKWCSNSVQPDLKTLNDIANVLDIDVKDLIVSSNKSYKQFIIMEVNKKELKEQEIRTLFITPALQQKGWAVSVNMREEYYFTDGRVLVVGNQHSVAEGKKG